jgi:hypothetical protein
MDGWMYGRIDRDFNFFDLSVMKQMLIAPYWSDPAQV